jgi:hypothetical protein
MTYLHGELNSRGGATGNVADNQTRAPIARVGVYWDFRYANGHANRHNPWINPFLTDAERAELQRKDTGGRPVCRSWDEWFYRHMDPAEIWLTGKGVHRNGLFVLEAPWGLVGSARRYQSVDERRRALATGKAWLDDGLIEGLKPYVDAGNEVAIHTGCPDEGAWARELLAGDKNAARREGLETIAEFDALLAGAGITIGHDMLSGFGPGTISCERWRHNQAWGVKQQLEATFNASMVPVYQGATCFVHYGPTFKPCHEEPQAPWAGPKGWGMPLATSKEFAEWYGEVRVVVPFDFGGSGAPTKENVEHQATEVRKLLALSPKIKVLLSDYIVRHAMKFDVKVERFLLPETTK